MAKAKSKNPIGRPRFEVTPEVLARTERAMAQGLTKEQKNKIKEEKIILQKEQAKKKRLENALLIEEH